MRECIFILVSEYQRISVHFTRTDYSLFFTNILSNNREDKGWTNVRSFGSLSIRGLVYTLPAPIVHLSQTTLFQ